MSTQVTTVNRLAARRLLSKAGVKAEMARAMSLKQLQEHIDNFMSLNVLHPDEVRRELAAAQGQNPNAGAPWSIQQDQELADHFARGMSLSDMASIRGRTVGGIAARLAKLGFLKFNESSSTYEITAQGKRIRGEEGDRQRDSSNGNLGETREEIGEQTQQNVPQVPESERKAGEFLTNEQIKQLAEQFTEAAKRAQQNVPQVPAVSDNDLERRVSKLEIESSSYDKHLRLLQSDYGKLQQTIADTIAAEVKRVQGAWQKFEIVTGDKTHKIEGLAHKAFPKLLRAVSARTRHDKGALNIWLYGPAGTGKSTAARKLAEAFNLEFHTNGPVGSQWDIRGFTDAQGRVVETAFRRAWEHGGVYCWDEGDGSAPAALIEANGALATGFASFPDKVVPRHPDCIVIINGNLRPGAAPDATYNGRYKQDTAFVNRFVAIEWGIDEDLERALLGKLDVIGEQWLHFVRKLRKKIAERGIKGIVVSPRQLQYGIALLDAGAELDEVMEQTVKFMFTEDQWKQVAA